MSGSGEEKHAEPRKDEHAHSHDHAHDAAPAESAPEDAVSRLEKAVAKKAAGPGKGVGITMALLGVMLAFCAALVGSHRTELIKQTIDQSTQWGIYQSEVMKFRLAEGDLAMLKAVAPDKEEEEKLESSLRGGNQAGNTPDDPDTAEIKDLIASSVHNLAALKVPRKDDEARFSSLQGTYRRDMEEAKHDAEAYDAAIEAHFWASEWYERAQLLAEIGIVIASVALLLASKRIWIISVCIALGSAAVIAGTFVRTRGRLIAAEAAIEEALKTESVEAKDDDDDDGKGDGKEGAKPEAKPGEK